MEPGIQGCHGLPYKGWLITWWNPYTNSTLREIHHWINIYELNYTQYLRLVSNQRIVWLQIHPSASDPMNKKFE